MSKRIKILFIGLFVSVIANCQISDSVLIKGQLISKDKNPLPGVSISIRGSKNLTLSDSCGKFEIWVVSEGVIVFSFIPVPYYISIFDIGSNTDTSLITFQFDFKQETTNCTDKILKAKKVRLDKNNRDIYSQKLIACYKNDLERLTWKYYRKYFASNMDIVFVLNGNVMDKDFTPDELRFQDIEEVFVFDNQSNNPNILFILSMIDKGRKERRP